MQAAYSENCCCIPLHSVAVVQNCGFRTATLGRGALHQCQPKKRLQHALLSHLRARSRASQRHCLPQWCLLGKHQIVRALLPSSEQLTMEWPPAERRGLLEAATSVHKIRHISQCLSDFMHLIAAPRKGLAPP